MIAHHALHFRGAKMIIKVGIKYFFQGFFIPLIDLLKYTSFKTSLCFLSHNYAITETFCFVQHLNLL